MLELNSPPHKLAAWDLDLHFVQKALDGCSISPKMSFGWRRLVDIGGTEWIGKSPIE
ncbi:hypothetical protein EGR_03768 [Echinococcus granulosus]|uniref:Uncharacterized protein n=1 Tax=Echinococcus granulosus TaxID=6210 RepID=W6USE0_ECHGR|nr:hypothetical protein EGR_03768 [Echinococcus granulosus]EUB61282.1 hypothetical protein EGR_03768 [Echinococcus granulosus]